MTHLEIHNARLKVQRKMAHLQRRVWHRFNGYTWLLALLDTERRYL